VCAYRPSCEDARRACLLRGLQLAADEVEALQRARGHKSRAAAHLNLTRFQLYTRLKRHQIAVTPD
jgi:transcriptional regulator of acetoin/glycerol metabolism